MNTTQINMNNTFRLLYCLIEILQYFEPTLWKFAGTALSGGGGVVEAKVCLAVGGVVALDDVHIYFNVELFKTTLDKHRFNLSEKIYPKRQELKHYNTIHCAIPLAT